MSKRNDLFSNLFTKGFVSKGIISLWHRTMDFFKEKSLKNVFKIFLIWSVLNQKCCTNSVRFWLSFARKPQVRVNGCVRWEEVIYVNGEICTSVERKAFTWNYFYLFSFVSYFNVSVLTLGTTIQDGDSSLNQSTCVHFQNQIRQNLEYFLFTGEIVTRLGLAACCLTVVAARPYIILEELGMTK